MFSDYPSGFSSRPPPPSPPPEEEPPPVDELLSSVTSSKTMLFGPPLVVAMLSFASRKVFATLKRILTRSIFFTVQSFATSVARHLKVVWKIPKPSRRTLLPSVIVWRIWRTIALPTCTTSSADIPPKASMSCAMRSRSKILASFGLRFRV